MTLLPFVELPHSGAPRAHSLPGQGARLGVWCEVEVAEAVLGVLVLTVASGSWGAVAGSFWQGLVGLHPAELGLRWRGTTREGAFS